jgi:hypothetical protein
MSIHVKGIESTCIYTVYMTQKDKVEGVIHGEALAAAAGRRKATGTRAKLFLFPQPAAPAQYM